MANIDINIIEHATKIKEAIEISLDPHSSPKDRQKAIEIKLDFMQNSDFCGDVGLYFFKQKEFNTTIKMCGLQILSHFIRSRWNILSQQMKDTIKKEIVDIVFKSDANEASFVKEGVVKVFVEVVKRTWPQEWTTLFSDLSGLQSHGDPQQEIVLKIFNVLSDDINGMDDKIKTQRKRDMLKTLNTHIAGLFDFFFGTLHARAVKLSAEPTKMDISIAKAALNTIISFVTWATFESILSRDNMLLKTLLLFLENSELKLLAAECLCTIFERKVQYEERSKMMILLMPDALQVIIKAAKSANEASMTNEDEYTFFKRLNDAVTDFGIHQISNLWGDEKGFKHQPENFTSYVELLMEFTQHDSLYILSNTLRTWIAFFSNETMMKNKILRKTIDPLLDTLTSKIMKDNNPFVKNKRDTSIYNTYDYSEVEEYLENLSASRTIFSNLLMVLNKASPGKVLYNALVQVNNILTFNPPDTSDLKEEQIMQTEFYIALEALVFYCKHSISSILTNHIERLTPDMLEACNGTYKKLLDHKYNTNEFNHLSLRLLETFFQMFKVQKEYLLETMKMLFSLITQVVDHAIKKEVQMQRSACIFFANICKSIPDTLCEIYDDLESYILARLEETHLTNHEKGVLLEGLLCISVKLKDTTKQKNFMVKITTFVKSSMEGETIQNAIKSADSLRILFGLHEGERNESLDLELTKFMLALHSWQAITRACITFTAEEVKDEPTDSFLESTISRFPWVQPMINILPNLFSIAQQYCLLWSSRETHSPAIRSVIESSFRDAKLDATAPSDLKHRFGKASFSILNVCEVLFNGFTHLASCHGPLLYSLPGLIDSINESLVAPWHNLSTYKLGKLWRAFVNNFVHGCPGRFRDAAVVPLLTYAIPMTFQRLNTEWKEMKTILMDVKKKEGAEDEDEQDEKEEIKRLKILHKCSDDFISCLCRMLTFKRKPEKSGDPHEGLELGDLGKYLLNHERLTLLLLQSLFTSLTWNSTTLVTRTTPYMISLIPEVFAPNCHLNPELPHHLLVLLIQSIEIHGGDFSTFGILVQLTTTFYSHTRMTYPDIVRIIMMIPGCTEDKLKEFDLEFFASAHKKDQLDAKKKKMRAQFRSLLEGARGKVISLLHKEDIEIKDLPKLPKRVKENRSLLHTNNEEIAGLIELFNS